MKSIYVYLVSINPNNPEIQYVGFFNGSKSDPNFNSILDVFIQEELNGYQNIPDDMTVKTFEYQD